MPENYGPGDDDQESAVLYLTAIVISQPANASGVIGGQAVFTFTYSAVISLFTLQWQIQTDGVTWEDLVETAGFYEGVMTTTLTVKAIDNFLATRTTRNFRCRLLFNGTVPTFTSTASLTVSIHTDWTPGFSRANCEQTGAFAIMTNAPTPVVTGFSGPYTYLWTQISGEAFSISNPTAASPSFFFTPPADGVYVSIWHCAVSNGIQTITTDPLYFMMNAIPAPAFSFAFFPTDPRSSLAGAALSTPFVGGFLGPWVVAAQRNIRKGITPAATIDTPLVQTTTFSLNGPNVPGTAVSVIVTTTFFAGGNNGAGFGWTVWEG